VFLGRVDLTSAGVAQGNTRLGISRPCAQTQTVWGMQVKLVRYTLLDAHSSRPMLIQCIQL
jgi:hypothetical protein